jgi:hypothetical protein
MANALVAFKNTLVALPDDLQKEFDAQKNIEDSVSVPSLTVGGRKWTTSFGGKKTLLEREVDGEMIAMSTLYAVVLDYNPNRSRSYYVGDYDPENPTKPDCWSNDGKHPDESVEVPQAPSCANCPMAAKNSRVRNGKGSVACSLQKFLAVQLLRGSLKNGFEIADQIPVLRLKLAITSIYDGQSPDLEKEGWLAWDNLVRYLKENRINSTAQVVIKMKFDPNVDYPKIVFAPVTQITDPDFAREILNYKKENAEVIKSLLSREFTPNGADGTATDEDHPPKLQAPKKAKAAPVDEDEEDEAPKPARRTRKVVDEDEEEEAPKARKKAAPVDEDEDEPAPKARKAKAPVEDEDEEEEAPKPRRKAAPVAEDEDEDEPAPKPRRGRKPAAEAPAKKVKAPAAADEDDEEDEAPRRKANGKAKTIEAEDVDIESITGAW